MGNGIPVIRQTGVQVSWQHRQVDRWADSTDRWTGELTAQTGGQVSWQHRQVDRWADPSRCRWTSTSWVCQWSRWGRWLCADNSLHRTSRRSWSHGSNYTLPSPTCTTPEEEYSDVSFVSMVTVPTGTESAVWRCVVTWLLSVTKGFMVNWTMNQVAFLRMKAEIRFQWMMFLRQRMLLQYAHTHKSTDEEEGGRLTGSQWTNKFTWNQT